MNLDNVTTAVLKMRTDKMLSRQSAEHVRQDRLKRPDSLIAASSSQDTVLIPSQLVTRDDVAEYKGWTSR